MLNNVSSRARNTTSLPSSYLCYTGSKGFSCSTQVRQKPSNKGTLDDEDFSRNRSSNAHAEKSGTRRILARLLKLWRKEIQRFKCKSTVELSSYRSENKIQIFYENLGICWVEYKNADRSGKILFWIRVDLLCRKENDWNGKDVS